MCKDSIFTTLQATKRGTEERTMIFFLTGKDNDSRLVVVIEKQRRIGRSRSVEKATSHSLLLICVVGRLVLSSSSLYYYIINLNMERTVRAIINDNQPPETGTHVTLPHPSQV